MVHKVSIWVTHKQVQAELLTFTHLPDKMFSHTKRIADKLISIAPKGNIKGHQPPRFIHNQTHRLIPQDRHLKRQALKVGKH